MKMTQELSEQIENYIKGSLSGKSLKDFEKTIESSPELQEEIKIQSELNNVLTNKKSLNFRKKLIEINNELNLEKTHKETNNTSNTFTLWKIAASILILIGISSLIWLTNSSTSEDLFSEYYVPYPIGDIKRGDESSSDDNFKKIVFNYKKKEYKKVIPVLENIIEQNHNNPQLKLCLGNSYLNTGQLEKAETIFLSFSKQDQYYNDATWFLSLTYLKMKKEKQVILLLNKLNSFDNRHRNNSLNLLKDLKK